jgi:hypothetical protein
MCLKLSESNGKNTWDERISAISFLNEIWMNYTQYVDSKPEVVSDILGHLKKGIREKYTPMRMVSICQLFKLLEKFSEEKNQVAPTIYKTLIFSFVDNPNDENSREMFYLNFSQLFTKNPSIPIGLLIEPLIKQIQNTEGISFHYKIFDFDFFAFAAK